MNSPLYGALRRMSAFADKTSLSAKADIRPQAILRRIHSLASLAAVGLLCLLGAFCRAVPSVPPVPARLPTVGQAAPAFTLPDVAGKRHTLASFRGRPVALFFFCGCNLCHACAQVWSQAQPDLGAARTVVVFSGDAASARAFAAETGLAPDGATLLADPDDRVTDRYHVLQCPRVFVLDAAGRVRDTNPDPNAPALSIVSRAVSALRLASAPSPGPAKARPSH